MLENKFIINEKYFNIAEIKADNPNTIYAENFAGDTTLLTQIGHLQLNLDSSTKTILSLDGIIGIPIIINLKDINFENIEKVSIQFVCNTNMLKGIGYSFNFSGKSYYDKNKQCLLIGKKTTNELFRIGENLYATLSKKDNNFELNSLIIKPIELTKNFKVHILGKAKDIDFEKLI